MSVKNIFGFIIGFRHPFWIVFYTKQKDIKMLLITLKIVLLFTAIITPLIARKSPTKFQYKIDTDTSNAQYAINENGWLEEFRRFNFPSKDAV